MTKRQLGSTAQKYNSQTPTLRLIQNDNVVTPLKYNKDGTVKQTKCNKQCGVSSETFSFKTKQEITDMISVFDKHIEKATDKNKRQIATRNKLLFVLGINIGIRASDLRALRWSFFFEQKDNTLSFRDCYSIQPIKQRKQHKYVKLYFNDTVKKIITDYLNEYPFNNIDDFVFPSRKGEDAIETGSMWRIIKSAANEAGINQNIGSHSLRKTFGYWVWHESSDKTKALVILQQIFNHSSTQTTAKYIGITDDEFQKTYQSIALGYECL